MKKILSPEDLRAQRETLRTEGRSVVQCHGCFDIVHPGHIRYLQFARAQGDVLIVSVSADEVVGKGEDRPYITEKLRMENLAALECVDYVCLDHNTSAVPILELLQPDVYVKGKEYETNSDPRFVREKQLVEDYGGKVVFSSGDVVYSSTFILSRFSDRFHEEHAKIEAFCKRHDVVRSRIEKLLGAISGKRLLVVGDPILDCYVECETLGVAAEGPMLSVSPIHETWYLGAAALMARYAVHLGAEVTFLTALGESAEADRFTGALDRAGVRCVAIRNDDRPVFVKRRYLANETKLLKVSEGRYAPPSSVATRELCAALDEEIAQHDGVIASDFGYGLFTGELIEALNELTSKHQKPAYVDVSGFGSVLKFRRPRMATPTEDELRFALGDKESGLSNLASRFYRSTGAASLVITLGKRGAVAFGPPEEDRDRLPADYLPAFAPRPIDAVGAGDVFATTLALVDLVGEPLPVGLYLASAAAAIQVSRPGNAPPDRIDLDRWLLERPELG